MRIWTVVFVIGTVCGYAEIVGSDVRGQQIASGEVSQEYITENFPEAKETTDSFPVDDYSDQVSARDPNIANPYSETPPQTSVTVDFPLGTKADGVKTAPVYVANSGLPSYQELYPGKRDSPTSAELNFLPRVQESNPIAANTPKDLAKLAGIDIDDLSDDSMFIVLSSTTPFTSNSFDIDDLHTSSSFLQV